LLTSVHKEIAMYTLRYTLVVGGKEVRIEASVASSCIMDAIGEIRLFASGIVLEHPSWGGEVVVVEQYGAYHAPF
jgi:hypothetical protein